MVLLPVVALVGRDDDDVCWMLVDDVNDDDDDDGFVQLTHCFCLLVVVGLFFILSFFIHTQTHRTAAESLSEPCRI